MWTLLFALGCSGSHDKDGETPDSSGSDEDNDGDGAPAGADCNDSDPAVFPGAAEHCDGVDEDCDGLVDNEPIDGLPGFFDEDGDGFGSRAVDPCDAATARVPDGGDCDDGDPNVFPGAGERCNGVDDDCDPTTPDTAEIAGVGFSSIAAALGAAVDGDTIEICDGDLHEHDLRVTAEVTVTSLSGDRDAAVIDGDQAGPVFVVDGGQLTLRSLTVRNGLGDDGGGGVAADLSPLTIEDCVFADHQHPDAGGAITATYLTVVDSVFSGNRAFSGGAIEIASGGTLTLGDSTFEDNLASGDGGAVGAFDADSVSIDGCTFARNSASYGGAVDVGKVLTVIATRFVDNTATFGGGAIRGGEVTVSGDAFEGNDCSYGGGGAIFALRSLAVDGSSFVGNYAREGGALHLWGSVGDPVTLDLTNTWLESNTADDGGAVYLVLGSGTADAATTFVRNTANGGRGSGGGVFSSLGEGNTWTGGTFLENTAAELGGGVYLEGEGTIAGVYAEGNSAYSGGGVYLDVPPNVLVDSVLVDNEASGAGGGASANDLYFTGSGAVVFERVELRGNQSPLGAGTDVYQTDLVMTDCIVEENVASNTGGGVYVWSGSSLTVEGSDLGVDPLDNVPDDVWAGQSYGGLGAEVSLACGSGCTPL